MTEGPIAITGATGFVGARLAAALARAGVPARALVRDRARAARLSPGLDLVEGDLASPAALARLVEGAGAVIHCAAATFARDDEGFDRVNRAGSLALAEAAKRAGVARFIHVSSLAAREPRQSAYGASKRAGEDAVRAVYGSDRAARLVIVRPPAVYGPGDRASLPLIAQLTGRRALLPGGPHHRFSLVYVDDLARALVHLATMADPPAGRFGIHDGRAGGYGWTDLALSVGEVEGRAPSLTFLPQAALLPLAAVASLASRSLGRTPRLTPDKVREFYHPDWVCRSNLFDLLELDFEPVPFTEGLSLTLDWYRRQGWLPARPAGSRTAASAKQGEPAQ